MAEQMQKAAQEMRTDGTGPGSNELVDAAENQPTGVRSPMGKQFADLSANPAPGNDLTDTSSDRLQQPRQAANASQASNSGEAWGKASADQDASAIDSSASKADLGTTDEGAFTQNPSSPVEGSNHSRSQADPASSFGDPRAAQQTQPMQQMQSMQATAPTQSSPSIMGSPMTMMDEPMSANPKMSLQMPPPAQQMPTPSMTPASELVQRQGRDWALPESMAGMHGNAIIRTMRLQCYPDQFVLLPAKSEGATEVFGFFNGDVDRATLELATALRNRIERWGPALPGGRWQPRLHVQIQPRGEMRFHQLRTLMNDSGIELVGEGSP